FTNIVLADEVNRAPAKVQSAMLEAMQERQVTIGNDTYRLPEPFLVLATENPIEQEGTYPLPEAQVDRFMFKLKVSYPSREEEKQILERMAGGHIPEVEKRLTPADILRLREVVNGIYMDEKIKDYIVSLVMATRKPADFALKDIEGLIEYGASPRATIYLAQAARANAFMRKRGYVTPEDVKSVGMDVLRHRVILTYEAEAEELNPEDIVRRVFETVEVP
ncbi:MAG: MoxR family ATPase, partial [Candidatus Glassbacteria bacterium]